MQALLELATAAEQVEAKDNDDESSSPSPAYTRKTRPTHSACTLPPPHFLPCVIKRNHFAWITFVTRSSLTRSVCVRLSLYLFIQTKRP